MYAAKAMKICFFISSMNVGGAERQASALCNHWAGQGHDVLLVIHRGGASHYPLHPSIRQRVIPATGLGALAHIRSLVRDERPGVAISFINTMNVKLVLALLWTGVPVVISERSVLSSLSLAGGRLRAGIFALLRRVFYPFARALVVQSRMVADEARKLRLSRNVQVISNASFPAPVSNLVRDGKTVLAVGRLGPEKGHDVLVRAFALVAAQYPGWRVKIVGTGPCSAMLKDLARRLGVQDRVDFAPVMRDIWPAYQAAEIFVLPSRLEGFPNVLVEAMRAGCAVVISDCPGAGTEIISDGQDGLVFRTDDAQGLAERLAELMADPRKRAAMGERARKSVTRYDPEVILPIWDRLIEAGAAPAAQDGRPAASR